MPFKSYAQMVYMREHHPELYRKWMKKYGPYKGKKKKVGKGT